MNLKIYVVLLFVTSFISHVSGQTEAIVPPSNRSFASLEKNVLFYADRRFRVTQAGSVNVDIPTLFDGQFFPTYSSGGIDPQNPYVLLIEDLPAYHAQEGAWVGLTTRYYTPTKFKIEVFDTYNGYNQWRTIADVSNNSAGHYIARVLPGSVSPSKIRFTIYNTNDTQNRLGISELFYIQPEATKAYDGLMVQYSRSGNVGIGTNNPQDRLSVNGKIRAHEIKVETANWPDYVFRDNYELKSLDSLRTFITQNGHLPEVPSAKTVESEGVDLGEMNKLLLKKIEELTLYLLQKDKEIVEIKQQLKQLTN
ncbi:hypothetical protein [Sphingobacterium thalpophilum]|uniref:hypothetical protein n=1 Tax=Sphingobacterium thalpophilum TaxID=259 RepID=UPI0031E1CBAE